MSEMWHKIKIQVWLTPLIFILLGVSMCLAQEESRRLELIRADSTRLVTTDEGIDSYSYGDVLFAMGDDRLYCERAAWQRSKGRIVAWGGVRLVRPGRLLLADSLEYTRGNRLALALGNVLLIDSVERVRIEGQRMTYDRRTNFACADSFPRMMLDFDDSASSTEIIGDFLDFDRETRRGWARENVTVHRGEWSATCGLAETWPDSGMVILTENPVGRGSNTETQGDSIILYSVNRLLEQVRVSGGAEGVYRPAMDSTQADSGAYTGEENRLWGQEIIFDLADNRLARIKAAGSARSQYTAADADTDEGAMRGKNHSSGDSLIIFMDEGKIEHAEILGGGRGTYLNPIAGDTSRVDTIQYFSDRIEFFPDSSRIHLFGNGKIDYGTIELTADQIRYDSQKKTLAAEGTPYPDSAGVFIGPPILLDGTQTVYGEKLFYNVNTGRGRILGSFTEFEAAYYYGDDLRKYNDREFFVEDGVYTTCDHDPPHYSFRGKTMKMIRGDKVISRPVVLYLDEMPVFAIPYYIFPIKPGRHSGFLSMRIGNFERGQRFVDNVGYYWAASQYWDLEAAVNIRESTGLQFHGAVNYALRYILGGSVSGTYTRESQWQRRTVDGQYLWVREKRTRWSLVGSHRHTVSPSLSISGSASFVSDAGYYTDYSYDLDERLDRTLRSQININKRWKSASLTAYLENTDNLDTSEKTRQLPGASFSLFRRTLVPTPEDDDDKKWYHSIYYSYSNRLSHYISKRTTGEKRFATLNHTASISAPQKFLGYITLSPQISAQETWYYVFDTDDSREAGVMLDTPARRGTFSTGISASTVLYGFLYPRLFGLDALRHTMTPSVSYSYTPAVTKHDELRSYTGVGGGSSRKSQTLRFNLRHSLDAKIIKGDKEHKSSLLTGSMTANYNIEAEERKWSTLSSQVGTSLARRVSLSVSSIHDLYNPVTLDLQWTNPRLTSFNISASTSLSGGDAPMVTQSEWQTPDSLQTGGLPYNASISYRYSERRSLTQISKSHWIGGSLQINPTPGWRVMFTTNYDLAGHQTSDQSFRFYRDLHCWEAQFEWIPGGGRQGYYFKVNVKDLPDVKLEKTEGGIQGAFR